MKLFHSICWVWFASIPVFAQNSSKEMDTKIEEVTVFFDGAQVFRTGKASLPAGRSELVVNGLSPFIDPNSISVKGKGNFMVLGVEQSTDYFKLPKDSTQLVIWQKKEKELKEKIAKELTYVQIYQQESTKLDEAMALKNTQLVQKSMEVKDLLDFYRSRSFEIQQKIEESQQKQLELQDELKKLSSQMQTIQGNQKYSMEIRILVNAEQPVSSEFLISYVVSGASWHPEYDIRLNEINKPLQVRSKAIVVQNTTENWKDVELTLSTGTPTKSATKPILMPYYLRYYDNDKVGYMYESRAQSNSMPSPAAQQNLYKAELNRDELEAARKEAAMQRENDMKGKVKFDASASAIQVATVEGSTNTSFEIGIPYSIPSDGKSHMVEIGELSIPANYQYQAVPKLDRDAFLVAQIVDWDKYDLMQANANIFLEGTFTGKTIINPGSPGDTLTLSLGRDKGIIIKREKIKDFSKNQTLGSDKRVERRFEISIRNNKKGVVTLVLDDQIPVSQNSEIEVEALDLSGASLDETTGKLKWELKLEPSVEQKLKFGYKLKYPKNTSIRLE